MWEKTRVRILTMRCRNFYDQLFRYRGSLMPREDNLVDLSTLFCILKSSVELLVLLYAI